MTKSYRKICDYCKKEIEMSDKEGKWLPYNIDNGQHDCRKKEKKQTVETLKQIVNVTQNNNKNHREITWEMVQKKLASIGINIDVEKLLKESDYIQ